MLPEETASADALTPAADAALAVADPLADALASAGDAALETDRKSVV